MVTYYKATRPDGTDFHTGTVDYAAALTTGEPVRHPRAMLVRQRREGTPGDYLSVSVSPTDCTSMSWPCRLFAVEPVGTVWTPDAARLPSKRACHTLRVVEELPAHVALGPQGEHVAALVERARRLSAEDAHSLYAARAAARDAARDAAWDAARAAARAARRDAARGAARGAAWAAARDAARDAAWAAPGAAWDAARAARAATGALVARDLIPTKQYDILTDPWRQVLGPIHPDDAPVLPDGVS